MFKTFSPAAKIEFGRPLSSPAVFSPVARLFLAGGAFDDFNQYVAAATVALLPVNHDAAGNLIWGGPGVFFPIDYQICYCNFENVGAGDVTSIVDGTGWNGDGDFSLDDYQIAHDDLETCVAGDITSVTGGGGWDGDGDFG
jgi:hypothetical protein